MESNKTKELYEKKTQTLKELNEAINALSDKIFDKVRTDFLSEFSQSFIDIKSLIFKLDAINLDYRCAIINDLIDTINK